MYFPVRILFSLQFHLPFRYYRTKISILFRMCIQTRSALFIFISFFHFVVTYILLIVIHCWSGPPGRALTICETELVTRRATVAPNRTIASLRFKFIFVLFTITIYSVVICLVMKLETSCSSYRHPLTCPSPIK